MGGWTKPKEADLREIQEAWWTASVELARDSMRRHLAARYGIIVTKDDFDAMVEQAKAMGAADAAALASKRAKYGPHPLDREGVIP